MKHKNDWTFVFAGKEPGNYRPLKFDEEISRGVKRVEQFHNGTLAIRRAKEQDHGYYLCHSSNRIGAGLSKVIFLKVHSKWPAQFPVRPSVEFYICY